jgi:hypothetical protein
LDQIFVVYVLVRVVIDQNRTEEGSGGEEGKEKGEEKRRRERRERRGGEEGEKEGEDERRERRERREGRGKSCAVLCCAMERRSVSPSAGQGTVMQD